MFVRIHQMEKFVLIHAKKYSYIYRDTQGSELNLNFNNFRVYKICGHIRRERATVSDEKMSSKMIICAIICLLVAISVPETVGATVSTFYYPSFLLITKTDSSTGYAGMYFSIVMEIKNMFRFFKVIGRIEESDRTALP